MSPQDRSGSLCLLHCLVVITIFSHTYAEPENSQQETLPPGKKKKTEINENYLYEASNYVVDLTDDEKASSEAALTSFDNTLEDGYDELFEATKTLQRIFVHLPLKNQMSKFPWLSHVS